MRRAVLGDGCVELIDHMGSDQAIVDAARVSYSDRSKHKSDTRTLIRYLMANRHTSPFEMAELKFYVKCPIFVARQWFRHRTGSFNEISGRYSELDQGHYTPDVWRGQSNDNKQGSDGVVDYDPAEATTVQQWGREVPEVLAEDEYRRRIDAGVSRELARTCLPLSTWTEFVWKVDLHNLMHFLSLRMDKHAQYEIRVYADVICEMLDSLFPLTMEAFADYRLDAMTLSSAEIHALKTYIASSGAPDEGEMQRRMSNREWDAFLVKCKRLGVL